MEIINQFWKFLIIKFAEGSGLVFTSVAAMTVFKPNRRKKLDFDFFCLLETLPKPQRILENDEYS